ncbi:hypothetical protein THAOC_25216 [Thalassiosira oceanica]|uniref:DUF6743 domain-containing protein n=1 Tax=Thalassiosira oceanica TaxID=159749 RepID=K0RPP7_THAOC|nr:hypothetical protein THAOC_25216 [Thalassiosira oceanica]|eukprot:EJK55085.1 hypothetical protein THAOC_25216 [Thalassiosira oceanica]
MRTDKEWMREDTWHFEVEVLRVYGRQELWSHGFGARPVSDGPYQPVDAADVRRRVAFGARQDDKVASRHCCVHRSRWSVVSGARVPRGTSKPLVTTSSASEREEAVRPHKSNLPLSIIFRCRSSPEKDLQHRLEVLALATDGEESCPMEGRPFQRMQAQRRPLAAPAPSLPLLLEVEHAKVTERGDLRLRPRMGRAPLSLPSGFRGGFQLQLTRTFARHDRARRPLDRVSEGVLRGRLQATHCGSAQPAVGSTPTRAMDQQRLRAQLYPHLPRTTAVGSTSLTLPTAVVFRVQLRLSNIKAI